MNSKKTPKHLLIGGLVVALVFLYPTFVRVVRQLNAKSHPQPAPTAPAPKKEPPTPDTILASTVAGKWAAQGLVDNRGTCTAQIEITQDATSAATFSAYLTLKCIQPFIPFWKRSATGAPAVNQLAPVSAVMAGSIKDSALQLRQVKAITDSCPITSATLTPFGTREMAIQWVDGCGDGRLILRR